VIALVVPTLGRDSLAALLRSLSTARGPRPAELRLVDDRRAPRTPLSLAGADDDLRGRIVVMRGRAAGPAAARNDGWRAARAPWIAFLDDDVEVGPGWFAGLAADLAALSREAAGSYGRIAVPLPAHRRPTDRERNVGGLATARWITADAAFRRVALARVGGFDERFPRAFREDADLALRLAGAGFALAAGTRDVVHPVRAADPWSSVRQQAGNADDVLMTALHGSDWYARAAAPRGAIAGHVATVAAAALALGAGAAWLGLTARFALRRIAPGPRDAREIATMAATSVAIPFAAVRARLGARLRLRATLADAARAPQPTPAAVLFDRDGTLVVDAPHNRLAAGVVPIAGARAALDRLRARGTLVGIVTNQSRVGEGALAPNELAAIHARVEELLGPFDVVLACTHRADAACACRKPAPGLVLAAAERLGVSPEDCVVIGDIGSDCEAARRAGARAILVPDAVTLRAEIDAAPVVARSLTAAVDEMLRS